MKKRNGFSFLELTVVLLITSLLFVVTFDGASYFIEERQISSTKNKIEAVEKAIKTYVLKNGKLPCPASFTSSSGASIDCLAEILPSGVYRDINAKTTRGAVPFKTLGLTPDYSYDSWGSKIIYIVSLGGANDVRRMEINPSKTITILNNYKDKIITEFAMYALISNGRNKYGSFNVKENNFISKSGSTIEEAYNFGDYTASSEVVYFNDTDVNPTKKLTQDDIVAYKTKDSLILDYDIYDIHCCMTEDNVAELKKSVGLEGSSAVFSPVLYKNICGENFLYYGEELRNPEDGTEESKLKIECMKYGRLGIMRY